MDSIHGKQLTKLKAAIEPQMLAIITLLQLEEAERSISLQTDLAKGLKLMEKAVQNTEQLDNYLRGQTTARPVNNAGDVLTLNNSQHEEMLNILSEIRGIVSDNNMNTIARETALCEVLREVRVLNVNAAAIIPSESRGDNRILTLSNRQSSSQVINARHHHQESEVATLFFALLHALSRSINERLMAILLAIPSIQYILRTLMAFTRMPLSSPQDLILFEDALGRRMNLEYSYFKDWSVFHAMLKSNFKGLPGELVVEEGGFDVIEPSRRLRLTEASWTESVLPGSRLAMSILFRETNLDTLKCPGLHPSSLTCDREVWAYW